MRFVETKIFRLLLLLMQEMKNFNLVSLCEVAMLEKREYNNVGMLVTYTPIPTHRNDEYIISKNRYQHLLLYRLLSKSKKKLSAIIK